MIPREGGFFYLNGMSVYPALLDDAKLAGFL